MNGIDIVITWVDQGDEKWREEKNKYASGKEKQGEDDVRFRDWGNLKYLFRGIEKNMPWIRNIYLVTSGQKPEWLDTEAEGLVLVDHKDYIPEEYLPTFNSNTIILNLFRIRGLSEQFIYFNDDMFAIRPVKPEEFFKGGKPRDMAAISPQPICRDTIRNIELNNLEIINDHFTVNDIKRNIRKWLNFRLYGSYALRTLLFMQFKTIIGIFEPHIPQAYRRKTFEKIWELEKEELHGTCQRKFRTKLDVSEWLARSWQLVSGEFEPRRRDFGKLISASDTEGVRKIIRDPKVKMICINDDESVTPERFEDIKNRINRELKRLFPERSRFEKCSPH